MIRCLGSFFSSSAFLRTPSPAVAADVDADCDGGDGDDYDFDCRDVQSISYPPRAGPLLGSTRKLVTGEFDVAVSFHLAYAFWLPSSSALPHCRSTLPELGPWYLRNSSVQKLCDQISNLLLLT